MNQRLQLLKLPHGGLRNALNTLCMKASSMDVNDAQAIKGFIEEVELVTHMLKFHSHTEDNFLHPLYVKACPAVAEKLESDHLRLDHTIEEIRAFAVKAFECEDPSVFWDNLTQKLHQYTADYFQHILVEEVQAVPALWEIMTDEQLLAIHQEAGKDEDPASMLTFLRYTLPYLNPPERKMILEMVKQFAPESGWNSVLAE